MSSLDWISPGQFNEWDAFVSRHPLGKVYHLSLWHNVLEASFPHIRGRFLVLRNDDGQIQAGLPVYNVKSWLLKNRTVSIPFATTSDPLISTKEEFAQLWQGIADTARQHNSKRIEIRTHRVNAEYLPDQMRPGSIYKHHYLLLDQSEDELLRNTHQSCIRRRIKRAAHNGVLIEERQDMGSLRELHALLVATRRRLGLPPMPFSFFEAMYRWLIPDHGTLYLALHENQVVGGALILKLNDQWIGEYSGHADSAPPGTDQLLYWHAIQCAHNSGAKTFSFGRTPLNSPGLLEYKQRWGTIEEDLTDFVWPTGASRDRDDSHNGSIPGSAYATLRLFRHAPPVVLKYLGDFCYRHLG